MTLDGTRAAPSPPRASSNMHNLLWGRGRPLPRKGRRPVPGADCVLVPAFLALLAAGGAALVFVAPMPHGLAHCGESCTWRGWSAPHSVGLPPPHMSQPARPASCHQWAAWKRFAAGALSYARPIGTCYVTVCRESTGSSAADQAPACTLGRPGDLTLDGRQWHRERSLAACSLPKGLNRPIPLGMASRHVRIVLLCIVLLLGLRTLRRAGATVLCSIRPQLRCLGVHGCKPLVLVLLPQMRPRWVAC